MVGVTLCGYPKTRAGTRACPYDEIEPGCEKRTFLLRDALFARKTSRKKQMNDQRQGSKIFSNVFQAADGAQMAPDDRRPQVKTAIEPLVGLYKIFSGHALWDEHRRKEGVAVQVPGQ